MVERLHLFSILPNGDFQFNLTKVEIDEDLVEGYF